VYENEETLLQPRPMKNNVCFSRRSGEARFAPAANVVRGVGTEETLLEETMKFPSQVTDKLQVAR
jgi:hypothetical protein